MSHVTKKEKKRLLINKQKKEARKLRDFIEDSSRTWLRPPYFMASQILAFTLIFMMLFFGYTSTRIAMEKRSGFRTQEPWVEANTFIIIVFVFFIPLTIWYCLFGWKWQANKEKKQVKEMISKSLNKILKEEMESRQFVKKFLSNVQQCDTTSVVQEGKQ